jgi:hypothetical protein
LHILALRVPVRVQGWGFCAGFLVRIPQNPAQYPRNRRARIKAEQQATKEGKEETTDAAAFDISVFESQAPATAFDSSTYVDDPKTNHKRVV